MLKVLQSNRLEILAAHLGEALCAAGPLAPDTIVVPNPGVARWLWLQLAQQHGISANLDCILPGSFIWRVFHCLLPGIPENSPYEPDVMAWRIHRLLLDARGDPAFSQLGDWRDTDDDRRRFELAQRTAQLFDQYIVYRPDWIERWRAGRDTGWQGELWRRLAAETGQPDWVSLRRRLDELDVTQVAAVVPQRVSLFGIPLLSPGYLEVMTWLSGHIDVGLFVPNPCREHWAHIVPDRDLARVAGVADEKTLYIETGNALLASWGGQGRDLLDLIQEIDTSVGAEEYVTPGADTLLHAIQTQVLELRDPGTRDQPAEPTRTGDRSIQVHVCHSPTRELEVLHDQLLALFDADPTLSASDVIVMTPDIDAYAPMVDAVFATPAQIPFYIADLSPRRGMAIIDTFLSLFDLVQERFDANSVVAVLESLPVRRRYGLSESDLQQIHDWVRNIGVRWGLDATGRAEQGREDAGLHSWRRGLDRLLLGFALPGERVGSFGGVLPYDDIEGSSALLLGSLAEYIGRLQQLSGSLEQSKSASEWAPWLHQQLEAFFQISEDEENEAQLLRNAINSLSEYAGLAGHDEAIGIDVALDWIRARLDSNASVRGFLGHGVTFAGIVPMRSVPFRVVCLIGLDGDAFPRIERPPGFDLIAREPRRGDRSRRDDDRQAFLECLLNTRDTFYVGYVGRGARDDTPLPPSVLVSELVDYCNRSFVMPDGRPAGDSLITLHRVQSFSARYFDGSDPALFTYTDVVAQPDTLQNPRDFVS
ncbi:MAG: exodeoxyribonuclease V subunit gamma, partial [Gammaproteobacteria bacterium]|nr:exodeoxyribonuclease V subunit gamma [Gammaproteobacteria bacterium]